MVSVLFVCMGNICRSPSAEAAFLQQVVKAGLKEHIHIQSAGTHDYHIGQGADKRSVEFAFKRGIDLSQHRAQQVKLEDFDQFDYILFMDEFNYKHLKGICPKALSHKMHYFLEYAPHLNLKEVPDPYYGGADGFEHVLDLVETASEGLLNHICQHDLLKESGTSQ